MSEYRLVMKGVVKTFPGVKALDHAQLELRPGKVMALMGENGAYMFKEQMVTTDQVKEVLKK